MQLSRISQAHSPPNHNALLHLSINCIHLHVISTLISLHTKAHTSHQHIVRSRFVRSGLMLLQLLTCVLTLISYLPPVSSPACSSQLYSIICVSKDLLECVSPVQDCEVCAPFPLSTSSCESKGNSLITLIILLCLFIEVVTHLHQLPSDSTDCNKTHLLYSNHLSESASLTEDRTLTEEYGRMSQPDPFQELMDNLLRVLLTPTATPVPPVTNITYYLLFFTVSDCQSHGQTGALHRCGGGGQRISSAMLARSGNAAASLHHGQSWDWSQECGCSSLHTTNPMVWRDSSNSPSGVLTVCNLVSWNPKILLALHSFATQRLSALQNQATNPCKLTIPAFLPLSGRGGSPKACVCTAVLAVM